MCGGGNANNFPSSAFVNVGTLNGDLFPLYSERKALFILNTTNLPNAVHDVVLQIILLLRWSYTLNNIWVLIDNVSAPGLDILRNLNIDGNQLNLVYNNGYNFLEKYNQILSQIADTDQYTSFYLAISSHGGQVSDRNGDENDGLDEAIYPNNVRVLDDDLHSGLTVFSAKFNILIMVDTCNSGTMFDLSKKDLAAQIISLSASADNQLSYEVNYDPSPIHNYLQAELANDLLLNYTNSSLVIGSLTFSILNVMFDKTIISNLNSLDVQTMTWLLTQLGQDIIAQSSRHRSQEPSPWIQLIWIVIIALILILIIFIGILISKSAYKQPTISSSTSLRT